MWGTRERAGEALRIADGRAEEQRITRQANRDASVGLLKNTGNLNQELECRPVPR
jgi:hypothetical protein